MEDSEWLRQGGWIRWSLQPRVMIKGSLRWELALPLRVACLGLALGIPNVSASPASPVPGEI